MFCSEDDLDSSCLDVDGFGISLVFSATWTCRSKSLMLQPTYRPDFLEFQRLLPNRISINVGGEVQIVLTSHHRLLRPLRRQATRSAMAVRRQQIASRAYRSTNCVSKAVVHYLVHNNDALAKAIRLSGGSDEAIQAALRVRCAVCERLAEPSPVPAASLRRWTEFGQCVALDLLCFADIT